MPIPVFGLAAGPRPAGRVPSPVERDGLNVELRVHGVGGTPPSQLLDDLQPEQVAGDKIAGFYRTADLLGVSPGPNPAPGGEPDATVDRGGRARHVEGYSWGGLDSRSSTRVLWLLLLPFLLANLSGWACSRWVRENRTAYFLHRVMSSLVGLLLTVNLVVLLCVAFADIAGYQAAITGSSGRRAWMWPAHWSFVAGHDQRQVVVGYTLVALVVGLVLLSAGVSRGRYEAIRPPAQRQAEERAGAPDDRCGAEVRKSGKLDDTHPAAFWTQGLRTARFWNSRSAVGRAANQHAAAAYASLALVMVFTQRAGAPPDGGSTLFLRWVALVIAAAILVVVVAAAFAPCAVLGVKGPFGLVGLVPVVLAGVCLWTGPALRPIPGDLPGLAGVVRAMIAAIGVVLFARCLPAWLAPARIPLPKDDGDPRLRGASGLFALLAFGVLNLFGMAGVIALGHVVGHLQYSPRLLASTAIVLPARIAWAAMLAGAGLICAVLVMAVGVIVGICHQPGLSLDEIAVYDEVFLLEKATNPSLVAWLCSALPQPGDGRRRDRRRWLRSLERWQWLGQGVLSLEPWLWVAVVLPAAAAVVGLTLTHVQAAWYAPSGLLGKTVLTGVVALPAALMGLLRRGWHSARTRRQIGVLWDVGSFWPRSFHPLGPPCYAERAVPDLQRRLWFLHDFSSNAESSVRLIGHSQGAVLAVAALLPTESRPRPDRIHLVTFGSPVLKLYRWAFPGWFNADVVADLLPNGTAATLSCQNFVYRTDPIAGAMYPGGTCPTADLTLPDPPHGWYFYGQKLPAVGTHSGYWQDAAVWDWIDEVGK